MTTPINAFQDILDALEREPELRDQLRRHIHTEDLNQLPAQFQAMLIRMDQMAESQQAIAITQQAMAESQQAMATTQQAMAESQQALASRTSRIEGRFGNFEGRMYEQSAINRIMARAPVLGIERPQIAFSKLGPAHQNFHDAIYVVVRTGLISQEQYNDLTEADLIVRGHRSHTVAEISLGPDQDDIERAARRAAILQHATGETTTAVIATPNPAPALLQAAAAQGVQVLTIPD